MLKFFTMLSNTRYKGSLLLYKTLMACIR